MDIVIGDVYFTLFALRSFQTLLQIKRIFFKVFLKNLTDYHEESLQCCCQSMANSLGENVWAQLYEGQLTLSNG